MLKIFLAGALLASRVHGQRPVRVGQQICYEYVQIVTHYHNTPTPEPCDEFPHTTVTQPYAGTSSIMDPITTTLSSPSGDTVTVLVMTPTKRITTTTATQPYTGSLPVTEPITTTLPPDTGDTVTVLVMTPIGYIATITTTQPYTDSSPITAPITTTLPADNGDPVTILVQTPGPTTSTTVPVENLVATPVTVTSTRPYTGTAPLREPITTTLPSGDSPTVTVFVETPNDVATPSRSPTATPISVASLSSTTPSTTTSSTSTSEITSTTSTPTTTTPTTSLSPEECNCNDPGDVGSGLESLLAQTTTTTRSALSSS